MTTDPKASDRPSNQGNRYLYKPEFCDLLIEHMAKGMSYQSFAGLIRVNQDTLYHWEKIHPEFKEAKKAAYAACRLWWDTQGTKGLYATSETKKDGKSSTTTSKAMIPAVYIWNMRNRFGEHDHQHETGETGDVKKDEERVPSMTKEQAREYLRKKKEATKGSGGDVSSES